MADKTQKRPLKRSELIQLPGKEFSPGFMYRVHSEREPAAVFVSALGKLDTELKSVRLVRREADWEIQILLKGSSAEKLAVLVHYKDEEVPDGAR